MVKLKAPTPRRAVISAAAAMLTLIVSPDRRPAFAADVTSLSLLPPPGSIGRSLFEAQFRPKPRQLPRRRLDLDFAVLLMRTSYSVADELNFVPMDQFQRDFFLLRQNEWDVYRETLPSVSQGDLADPAYFDFISFAQHATLASEMRDGQLLFNELVDANGTAVVVSRAASTGAVLDNAALPAAHAERVGARVLEWALERYPTIAPKLTGPSDPLTAAAVTVAVKQLANVFELNDFMLGSRVTPIEGGVELALVAPANLWSLQTLRVRGDLPNDFAAKVVLAWMRASGLSPSCSTRIERGAEVVHTFRWARGQLS